jgi:hypothetical protein
MSVPGVEADENGAGVEAYWEMAPANNTRLRQVTFLQHSAATPYKTL